MTTDRIPGRPDTRVSVRRGDVRLEYAAAPSMVETTSTQRGDIDIAVPGGATRDRYLVRSSGTTGSKQVSVEPEPGEPGRSSPAPMAAD
jgi:hypothetical protein